MALLLSSAFVERAHAPYIKLAGGAGLVIAVLPSPYTHSLTLYLHSQKSAECLPAEDAENQVEHEERADHNQGHEVDAVEATTQRIIGLPQVI